MCLATGKDCEGLVFLSEDGTIQHGVKNFNFRISKPAVILPPGGNGMSAFSKQSIECRMDNSRSVGSMQVTKQIAESVFLQAKSG